MSQHPQQRELFAAVGRGDRPYPFVPQGADVTNSPGTRLRFRLPVARPGGWRLVGAMAFCLVWNTCVAVAIVLAHPAFIAGQPDWLFTILILPFLLIGVGSVFFLVRKLLIATGIGPTLVESPVIRYIRACSVASFFPGRGLEDEGSAGVVGVCGIGRLSSGDEHPHRNARSLPAGTAATRSFSNPTGQPFETEFDLNVPSDAMHSFVAEHNQVAWTLVIEGDVADWPNFHRAFTVIVQPGNGDAERRTRNRW